MSGNDNEVIFAEDEARLIESAHVLHEAREELNKKGLTSRITFFSITQSFNNICFSIRVHPTVTKDRNEFEMINYHSSNFYLRYQFKSREWKVCNYFNKARVLTKSKALPEIRRFLRNEINREAQNREESSEEIEDSNE